MRVGNVWTETLRLRLGTEVEIGTTTCLTRDGGRKRGWETGVGDKTGPTDGVTYGYGRGRTEGVM